MSLTELQAQRAVVVKSLEQARNTGGRWLAGDAKEATRATNELVGAKAPFDQFLARRAELAIFNHGGRKMAQDIGGTSDVHIDQRYKLDGRHLPKRSRGMSYDER